MKRTTTIKNLFCLLAACLTATLAGCYVYSDNPPPPPVIIIPAATQVPVVPAPTPQLPPPAPVGAPAGEVGPIR